MNQQTSDQGWQQLQDHLESFWGQALRDNVQRIEYKSLFFVPMLAVPSEGHQNELEGTMAISDNFSQKGGDR